MPIAVIPASYSGAKQSPNTRMGKQLSSEAIYVYIQAPK